MPADPTLAERLREATGPSRELDAEIALAFGWERKLVADEKPTGWYWKTADYSWSLQDYECPPAYTASIDNIVELVQQADAEFSWTVTAGDWRKPCAWLWRKIADNQVQAEAPTPALALCLALVEWRAEHGGA